MKITLEHVRTMPNTPKPGMCMRGARAWFAHYGLDFDTFRKEGIDHEVLLGTGDPFALRVVAHARGKDHGQR